ncbi:hypothetical protein Goari_004265 [Gossypium aridum]|uniref:Uncharacterized protein n=1 Tax=Gossypium aridum TaxID=34290 RepID=A0A7J8Y2Y6_GOSAI|nr:hypothetical protein [Gossypium aridum]
MGKVKKVAVEGYVVDFGKLSSQSRGIHGSNMDALQALLNTTVGKLTENNDALEPGMIVMKEENKAIVMTLNTRIEELEGELMVYRILMGKNVLGAISIHKINVLKPKKFKGARSARDVDNLL